MINKQPLWILFEEYEKNNPPENSNIPTPTRYILFYSKVSQNYGKPHKHWTKEGKQEFEDFMKNFVNKTLKKDGK